MLRLPDEAERLVLAAQGVSPRVRLVGGTGLALLLGHRVSADLDIFCGLRDDIEPVVRAVETAAGGAAHRVRTGPGFARLEITGGAPIRVDVAADTSRRLVEADTYVGEVRVESLRDQRANKIVALLGRSELRDLVDLFFIEEAGLPVAQGFDDALAKDGGMDPLWFAWALDQIEIAELGGLLRPVDTAKLRSFRDGLVRQTLAFAAPPKG